MVGQIATAVLARCRCCTRLDRKARKNVFCVRYPEVLKALVTLGEQTIICYTNPILHLTILSQIDSLAHSLRL